MAFEILMPQLGLTMEEGTVTQWLKQEGDPVKAGEAVLEITTDKLTNEVTSEHDGVLLKIVAQEGEDIPVKGLLGYIGQAGEQVGDTAAPAPAAAPAQASAAPATPAAAPAAAPSGVRIRISPYARKLAAGMGVDYSHLTGSGPSGRIVAKDILAAAEAQKAAPAAPAAAPAAPAAPAPKKGGLELMDGDTVVKLSGMRKVVAERMLQSHTEIPPVTQNTKRFVRCFWALDKSLAYARHYPAINWNDSYSEYLGDLGGWYYDNVGHDFMSCRERIANLLLQENNLMQIVKLIGSDVLPDDQKLTIEIARVIRVGFLQQNAFHAVDTYVPLEKQLKMMETILYLYDKCAALVAKQVPVSRLLATGLFDELVQMKYTVPNDDLSKLDELQKAIDTKLAAVAQG